VQPGQAAFVAAAPQTPTYETYPTSQTAAPQYAFATRSQVWLDCIHVSILLSHFEHDGFGMILFILVLLFLYKNSVYSCFMSRKI